MEFDVNRHGNTWLEMESSPGLVDLTNIEDERMVEAGQVIFRNRLD